MKVDKIIPCICMKDKEDYGSLFDGMPILYVDKNQHYSYVCPKCGKGLKLSQYKSAYLALKNWNEMQQKLNNNEIFIFNKKKKYKI